MKIDSHVHFWTYDPVKDAWIDDSMTVLKRNFYPADLKPLLGKNGIDGVVAVQADQSERETHFLLELAERFDFIKGVVGWVDLRSPQIDERLEYFSQFKKLKGFRHIVEAEPQDDFLLQKDFLRGILLLQNYGYTYDILIYHRHLPVAYEFARRFPDQPFVLDHIAKPDIQGGRYQDWLQKFKPFSALENVSCKISGMVSEADWHAWTFDGFKRYIDAALEVFGPDRVMFGSDWPVCSTAATYDQVCEIVARNTEALSSEEQDRLWGLNCVSAYQL